MIAAQRKGNTVQDTMVGESYQAGIDDEDMAHVISLFTDLYSDPEAAVIREYSTNAHDAQIEAGYVGPIEVSLPSSLAPFFTVQDYGVGLTAEDIKRIYSRYGSSTKRNTNAMNGMLGLGCKSALTYTQQFTIESVKDGERTVCAVSRPEHGVPVFKVVGQTPTTERNGTKVVVPVQRYNGFGDKAKAFYAHWEAGSVLVNGKEPEPFDGMAVGKDFIVYKGLYGDAPNLVVMGNVAYPVDKNALASGLPYNYGLVIRVPIGAVSFTPSREALMYTPGTQKTLDEAMSAFKPQLTIAVQAEVDRAPTRRAAIQAALQWKDLLNSRAIPAGFTYRKRIMPQTIDGAFEFTEFNSHKLSASRAVTQLSIQYAITTLFVTGYDRENFTPTHKRKLMQFCEEQHLDPRYFALMAATSFSDEWVEPSQVVKWEDVNAVKLPKRLRTANSSGRIAGSYDMWIDGNMKPGVEAADIDLDNPVFYFQGNSAQAYRQHQVIAHLFPENTTVLLSANRVAKFTRDFPDAFELGGAVRDSWNKWVAKLTSKEKTALLMNDIGAAAKLRPMDPSKVDDPLLAGFVKIAKMDLTKLLEKRSLYENVLWNRYDRPVLVKDWKNPLASYPLFSDQVLAKDPEHVYTYLNAAYAANHKEA